MFIATDAAVDVGNHVLTIGIGPVYLKITAFIEGGTFLEFIQTKVSFWINRFRFRFFIVSLLGQRPLQAYTVQKHNNKYTVSKFNKA